MTATDAPEPGGPTCLLNPRRSAHATIRGYLYQTCLGVLRWLDLKSNEILLCEGDEDLDRFLLGGESVSEQVKAYTGGLSISDRAVLESLGNFLRSYVALRRQGETRRFVFTTTAQQKGTRRPGINFDLLEAWKAGKRTPEIFAAVRSRLEPKEDDKNHEETAEALAWLEAENGWKNFMDAVEWSFNAPDLDEIHRQIKKRLGVREDTRALPAETFLERLVAHVLRTSSQSKPEDRILSRKSLSDLIKKALTDLDSWAKTPAAQRLRTIFDELKLIQRLLHDNTATIPGKASPGKLLTAAYEVIPFDEAGRREELDFLTQWCESGERRSVLLLTGEGGSGKTRLMIEWCRHLRHLGWHAGFLRQDREAEALDPLLEGSVPRLVVLDYAETRLGVLKPMLLKMGLAAEGQGPKLRLVLLARRKTDWWENLSQRSGREIEDLLLGSPEPRMITPLIPKDASDRERAFRAAVKGFSLQLGLDTSESLHIPDLSKEDFERVLYLHMAALAALRGERIETADDALKRTLAHERQFWRTRVSNLRFDGSLTTLMNDAVEAAGAAITLAQGAKDIGQGLALVARALEGSHLPNFHLTGVFLVLRDLYGRSSGEENLILDPLQPDLLGEELVAEALSQNIGLLAKVLDGSSPEEGHAVLTVLTRLARRRPELEDWISVALRGRLEALGEIALDVAVETGDPLGIKLAEVIESEGSIDVVARLQLICDNERFKNSVPLREVAHVATEIILTSLRKRQGNLDEVNQIKFANLANNLSTRLSFLGRHKEAHSIMQEAIEIGRQLVQRGHDDSLSDLAIYLSNMSNILKDLGQREEALGAIQEAAEIGKLALLRHNNFLPDLATILHNWGSMLIDLGRYNGALSATQEAVKIRRQLAQQSPGLFLPPLAMSLNNLGIMLSKLGRSEEALRETQGAVEIYRRLTQQRPDVFSPELSASLDNLSARFSEIGQREESLSTAQEAVKIRRQLARQRPEAFLPDLAASLNSLGSILFELVQYEDALSALQEAVEIYRHLTQQRPELFMPHLAKSLNNLGATFNRLGQQEKSFEAYEEAILSLRPFFLRLPHAFHDQMIEVVRSYLKCTETANRSPDEMLLAPIIEISDSIQQSQSAE